MNVAKQFQKCSTNFQNIGEQNRQTHLERNISGVHYENGIMNPVILYVN